MPPKIDELDFPYKMENIMSDFGLMGLESVDSKIHKLYQTFSWLTKAIRSGDRKKVRLAKHIMHQQIGHILDLVAPLSEVELEQRMIHTVCAFITATERLKLIEPDTILSPPKDAIKYCSLNGVDIGLQFSDLQISKETKVKKLTGSSGETSLKSAELATTETNAIEDKSRRARFAQIKAARKRASIAKKKAKEKAAKKKLKTINVEPL